MAALSVKLQSLSKDRVPPSDVAVVAVVANTTDKPVPFNDSQAQRASLVLQIEDQHGKRLLLPPPSIPTDQDRRGKSIAPDGSVEMRYEGFFDCRLKSGRYRVRYYTVHSALGGSPADPLASDWLSIDVWQPYSPFYFLLQLWIGFKRLLDRILDRLLWWRRCRRMLEQEVDRGITETISDAPPGSEAWNGTYGWHARFQLRIEEANCQVVVTMRIRLSGSITDEQRTAWEASIESAWTDRFKSCADLLCCANGLPIIVDIQYVASNEHHAVIVHPMTTLSMNTWGATDTIDVRHEVGHMLGNKEEYFTVDGTPYGPARQPAGNIMNNPANLPVAAHYWLAQEAINSLLGETGTVKAVVEVC